MMMDQPDDSTRRSLFGGLFGGAAALSTWQAAYAQSPGGVRTVGAGPLIRNDSAFEDGVRLSRYGYTGHGNDDTAIWRDAIAEAAERHFRRILVPAGTSPIATSIVDGLLPAGLTFEGEAPMTTSPGEGGVTILHGGSTPCWRVDYRGRDPWGETGGWTWRNLRLLSAVAESTLFDFNDPTHYDPKEVASDNRGVLRGIRFENCYLDYIGTAQKGRTGDGIRAAKTYGIYIDPLCRLGHFRRSIWLHGCDDCVIAAHSIGGQRGIMHEAVNTYGSNLLVTTRFFTSPGPRDVEDAYQFWDSGGGTTLLNPSFEDQGHARALLYLNGTRTRVLGARFAGGPLFELGPEARECLLLAPDVAVPNPRWKPIIAPPTDHDFGIVTADRRLLIAQPGRDMRRIVGAHPRVLYDGGFPGAADAGGAVAPQRDRPLITDGHGARPSRHLLTPLLDTSSSRGTQADAGPSNWAQKAGAGTSGDWTFQLSAKVEGSGINWPFVAGEDWVSGDRLRIRARLQCADFAGWSLLIIVNGRTVADLALSHLPVGRFCTIERHLDTRDQRRNDQVRLTLCAAGTRRADLYLAFMEVLPIAEEPVISLDG